MSSFPVPPQLQAEAPLPAWPAPPKNPRLATDEVHVWRASLRAPQRRVARLYATLSADEQERADHFRFVQDQQRFIVARGLLRAVLGLYLGVEAAAVRFAYNPHGKPELEAAEVGGAGVRQAHLQFNLAHSEDLLLCAISSGRRVGIDVERIRPGFADGTLAETFFAPGEVAVLRALPRKDQEQAFFACWTRKEAYLKARGEGLIMPLDAFEVSLRPGEPAALLQAAPDPAEVTRWSLCELDLGPAYAATLAVEGQGWRLWLWQYPDLS